MVVEAQRRPGSGARIEQASFDSRSTALSLSSRDVYRTLNIWNNLLERAEAICSVHVSSRGGFGSTVLDCAEEGLTALGYVLENPCLGATLYDALDRNEAIILHEHSRVTEYRQPLGLCRISSQHNGAIVTVDADLVVLDLSPW